MHDDSSLAALNLNCLPALHGKKKKIMAAERAPNSLGECGVAAAEPGDAVLLLIAKHMPMQCCEGECQQWPRKSRVSALLMRALVCVRRCSAAHSSLESKTVLAPSSAAITVSNDQRTANTTKKRKKSEKH